MDLALTCCWCYKFRSTPLCFFYIGTDLVRTVWIHCTQSNTGCDRWLELEYIADSIATTVPCRSHRKDPFNTSANNTDNTSTDLWEIRNWYCLYNALQLFIVCISARFNNTQSTIFLLVDVADKLMPALRSIPAVFYGTTQI